MNTLEDTTVPNDSLELGLSATLENAMLDVISGTMLETVSAASLVSMTVFRQRVVILAVLSFLAMC